MPVVSKTFDFVPIAKVRDEIVELWKTGLKTRKWKMVEGMQSVDWDEVRRRAIAAWFPKLMQLNPRYAIKYAARLAEVEGVIWKERYNTAVSSDYYDRRLDETKTRFQTGGRYTIGAIPTITDAIEFISENLLSEALPQLGGYLKPALIARFVNHAIELMFVSIGLRNGWLTEQVANNIVNEINGAAEEWWASIALPNGYAIEESWNYKTNIDGSMVTITITRPE